MTNPTSRKMVAFVAGVIAVALSSAVSKADSMDNMSGTSSKQMSMHNDKKMMRTHHRGKSMSMKTGKDKMSSMDKMSHTSDNKGIMQKQ